jgi:serine phosphatase RsbU (regulator of sigma subunit)
MMLRTHADSSGEKLLNALLEDAKLFSSSETFEDDICLLTARFLRPAPPIG